MVYYRRYKKNYRKNRTSKVLRNSYIYGNKSASAQSKQIAALRTRLNYFARQNRPEIKSRYSGATEFTFSNSSLSSVWQAYPGVSPPSGTGDNERVGDFIKIKSLTWNLTFEYYDDRPSDQSHPDSNGAMIRVIILQFKNPVASNIITNPENVIEVFGSTGASYTHNAIVPLKKGIVERFNVLADKKWTITEDKNQLIKRIKVKPKNYRYEPDGTFNNVICMILVSGLHYDSSLFTQYVKGSFSDKIVYTDA